MQQFLALADKIPWVMAPAIIIAASVIIAVLVAVNRLLALSAWAMVMQAIRP